MPGFGEIAEALRRSTVQVLSGADGSGSGVIWREDGLILTNAHVVRGPAPRIELWDGRKFPARITMRDDRRDVAALAIDTVGLPKARPGDTHGVRPGELVMAVGNPLGFIGALTTGVVHAVGPLRGLGRRTWVQAAVRLAPGNSGGPLADAQGRVIGLNTMVVAGGLALAVPTSTVETFLARGAQPRPALGITVRPVRTGLMILEMTATGAAARASLQPGDLLTGVNGKPVESADDLADLLEENGNTVVRIEFLRGGRPNPREVAVDLRAARAEAA